MGVLFFWVDWDFFFCLVGWGKGIGGCLLDQVVKH